MPIWNHYIAGVEDIWCLLGASVFLCVLLTWRLLRSMALHRIASFHREQSGATYMLPLVLTMPFYVLLITMIIECTLMLTAKIGSVGAAYAAARAAAVWLPYESAMPKTAPDYTPMEDRELMVRLAAARSMWPYASGSKSHVSDEPLGEFIDATIAQQIEVFQHYSGDQKFDLDYVYRKFAYALNASRISIDYFDPITGTVAEKPAFNSKLQLTLYYEAPIHTFGVGRLFGEESQVGKYFVRPIMTTVSIENEGVKPSVAGNKISPDKLSKSLGIRYYDLSNPNKTLQTTVDKPISRNQLSATNLAQQVIEIGRRYAHENSGRWSVARYGSFTCNIAVADILIEAGVKVPVTTRTNMFGNEVSRPPLAGEWGDSASIIPGWEVVTIPKPGDIVAIAEEGHGYSGHVGIVSSVNVNQDGTLTGTTISQSSYTDTIVENDWGFRPDNIGQVFWRPTM